MKTFAVLTFLSALSIPSALTAEFAGAELPSALDPTHLFAGFALLVIAQIVVGDYVPPSRRNRFVVSVAKAAHPLAA